MITKARIVAYAIVKTSNRHSETGKQYAVRITLASGGIILKRLPGMFPTSKDHAIEKEPQEFQNQCHVAAFNILSDIVAQGPKRRDPLHKKTCEQAMREYVEWHMANRRNPKIKTLGDRFIKYFHDKPLAALDKDAACRWADTIIRKEKYKFDTFRLTITTASGMISWLEEQGLWKGVNPFSGVINKYRKCFTAQEPVKAFITEEEAKKIQAALQNQKYRAARIFIEVARCTGLRPSEILGDPKHNHPGISAARLDHENLTWTVLVSKTRGRQFYRTIAIPQCLSTYIANEGITGTLPIDMQAVRYQFEELRKETAIEFTQKTFRKAYAHMMENASAPDNIINLHQGRSQYGVLHEHYLTDPTRAVRLCRPYISKMFGEVPSLTLVR